MDKSRVKRHRSEFITGAGVVVGAVICVIVGRSLCVSNTKPYPVTGNKIKGIDVPDGFSIGKVTDLFEDGDEIVAITTDLTVNDLGKFGEELVKYGLVADGTEAAITAEFLRNV